jgi:transposase
VTAPLKPWEELTTHAREALRSKALDALAKGGSLDEVAAEYALSAAQLASWWHSARATGRQRLAAEDRPRPAGQHDRLHAAEQRALREALLQHSPAGLALDSVLWTRAAVIRLAALMFRVSLGTTTVTTYLREWGYASPRPHRHPAMETWRREMYPVIKTAAATEDALLLYAGHHAATLHPARRRVRTPPVPVTVITAYTPARQSWFALYDRPYSLLVLLDFLARLLRQHSGRIHLVLPMHDRQFSKRWHAWLNRHADRVTHHLAP